MALSVGQRIGWGLADLGIVVFVVIKQLLVLAYLTAYLGVPVGLAGALTSAVLLFDIVTDPLVGILSDRTKSRWGRRMPWMAVGALILALAVVALFSVPLDLPLTLRIVWVMAAFAAATVGFTCVAVPYNAMAGELTHDPVERSRLMAWRMAWASIGILIGGAVIPALRDMMGYGSAALIVAPLIIGSIWISLWSVRHAPRGRAPATLHLRPAFALIRRNRPFMVLMALYGVMTMGIAVVTAGLEFATLYLIIDAGGSVLSGAVRAVGMLSVLFASFVIGALISQPLWFVLSGWMGKRGFDRGDASLCGDACAAVRAAA